MYAFCKQPLKRHVLGVRFAFVELHNRLHPLTDQVGAQHRPDVQVIVGLEVRGEIDDLRVFRGCNPSFIPWFTKTVGLRARDRVHYSAT